MFKNFLDDFYDILFNYRKGLPRIAAEKNIWHGLIIYLIVTVIISLATLEITPAALNGGELLPQEIHVLLPPQALEILWKLIPLFTILLQVVFGPIYFLLLVAILHFFSALFGGNGKASSLGAVIGYAYIPYLLVAIGGLLGRYTTFNIAAILTIGAFFWSLWLRIAGLKEVNDFSWGRATLVYFMPLIILLVALIIFILLVIVFIVPLLIQVWEGLV